MRKPDPSNFEWTADYLGLPVPIELRELHESGEAEQLGNTIVDHCDTSGDGLYFCIAYWIRQNEAEYASDAHYDQLRLLISRDHAGNICFALPEENFDIVYKFDHETRLSESLSIGVSKFIELARAAKLEDE